MMRLAIACLVALQGCTLLESSSFQIMVTGSGTESHPETGEAIQLNNSLDDFRGLAGLEVGALRPRHTRQDHGRRPAAPDC